MARFFKHFPCIGPTTITGQTIDKPLRQRISQAELRRRLWHTLPGLLVFLLPLVPHGETLHWTDLVAITTYAAILTTLLLICFRTIARPGERHWLSGVLGYPATVLLTLLAFPSQYEFAAVVLAVLAFGDSAATLCGTLFGRHKLPWNRRKSWAGSMFFVVFAIPMGSVAYWWVALPCVPIRLAIGCASAAAIAGAIAESFPSKINDNIRVGLAAAVAVVIANAAMSG